MNVMECSVWSVAAMSVRCDSLFQVICTSTVVVCVGSSSMISFYDTTLCVSLYITVSIYMHFIYLST